MEKIENNQLKTRRSQKKKYKIRKEKIKLEKRRIKRVHLLNKLKQIEKDRVIIPRLEMRRNKESES